MMQYRITLSKGMYYLFRETKHICMEKKLKIEIRALSLSGCKALQSMSVCL